ncbi:uncharacterized protein LOC118561833 isoform X1 [Fundulus heteroclitus]|uniref:uncharacterized protein LOC118561833 isoform X1 n=1 Tax=Fundulus heteroclitus TaxID=8078 RepID=UPI00165BB1CF|nr:uncharacterized protein LOC118561833 isoform X1 [Fundulus heteroclitus]XP_035989962.1 uncharacterized protein LOC118561833 isoform X1 [Fundulus heteroclitus]
MPEGKFSFGFLATPGASAAQLRREVQKAVLPRTPEVVCLLAPSNNLTASRTPEEAAVDFDNLLTTICSRWTNVVVVDFPPRLVVEESLQLLLRQAYHRVAVRRSVRYLSVAEYFPLSRLELWSKDGVHLSDSPGMEVLAQLLWVATYTQLEASEPKSPAPVMASPPPVRSSPPSRLVVVGEVASPHLSNPFEWTLVEGGQKQQVQGDVSPHTSKRMVDQQGDLLDSSIPPNPVWFSPALLEEMDRIVPSSGCDFLEPTCAPKGKKTEGALPDKTRPVHHQPRREVPPTEDCALEPAVCGSPVRSVRATHSQADRKYGIFSRNHQCACMALTFLAYHNEGLQFDKVLLDRVLEKGDALYVGTKQQLMLDGTFTDDHLTVEEMPRQVLTDRNIYTVHTTGIRVGYVFRHNDSPPTSRRLGLDLASQLECLSENVTHAFLLVTPEFIAVFRDGDGRFGVFDSHSRNSAGLPHPNGTAIMKTFSNLTLMVQHLYKLFQNRGPRASYEFVPVGFVNDCDDAPPPMLDSVNISPGPTEARPEVQKPESTSDQEEMPPWLCDVANTVEETFPTVPDVTKMPKARRQKVKQRIQAQFKQSTSKKERYDTYPTFNLTKQQALKKRDFRQQDHRKDQITSKYKTDPAFRLRQINYVKERYRTDRAFRTRQKMYIGSHLRAKYNKDPSYRSQKREYIRARYSNNPTYRARHNKYVTEHYSNNPAYRSRQKKYVTQHYSNNPAYRSRQKKYVTQHYSNNPAYRSRQKKYVTQHYSNNPAYRSRQKKYIKLRYEDPNFRARHKRLMRKYMSEKYRTKLAFRVQHIKKCTINKKLKLSKEALSNHWKLRCALRIRRKYRRNFGNHQEAPKPQISPEMNAAIKKFQDRIRHGPTYVCTVCHRALFPGQVKHCNRGKYKKNMRVVAECLTGTYVHVCGSACSAPCSVPEDRMQEWICYTCDNHLFRGGMPPIAAANGLHLSPIPPELAGLNVLERQLISKIIPFAKIVSLPKGQQKAVHGAVVCVPSEMETTVNSLPRPSTEAQLLQVKLKRKIKFKGHQYFYTVNMKNVLAGLATLKRTHPDYRDVTVNESAAFDFQEDEPTEESIPESDHDSDVATEQQPEHIGEEHQALRPGLVLDTCMQPPDLAQEVLSYGDGIFSIAPAQGNKPVSFFGVPRLESMAYPVQFPTGRNTLDEARRVKLSPSMYFNVRLFSVDTRFAADQSYLFFAQFVTETHMANNSMSIQTRKGKPTTKDGRNISSKMLQDKEEVETLIQNKEATRFMQPLRGTPAYWEKGLRDLHAMVRQLGKPTFFVTFSAAEMRWPEFIEAIKAQHGEQVAFSDLDWNAKCDILRSNPVTVMRMFEKRVDALFTDLILSPAQPLGPVEDYFYRVEFQARGSPHIHAVIWINDAPEMEDPACCDGVINFIDRYICCQLPDETADPELHKIVKEVQMHSRKHSKSCKKGNVECRFGFPKLPMERTTITVPQFDLDLEDDVKKAEQVKEKKGRKKSKKSRSRIISTLQTVAKKKLKPVRDLLMDEKSSFKDLSELLQACNMTRQEYRYYVDALTSGMVVMMKRDPRDTWVNGYNPVLLRAWNANMDIQYVLDEYSCIEYMMSYIAKPEHEMAQYLKSVVEDLKKSNVNQQDEMKKIMQAYSKQREVSAQESVARTCSLPLKKSSRSVIFIQTGEDAVKMSLPMSRLMNMGPDEEDIWMKGLPDKYVNRPQNVEFEDVFGCICL